MTEELIGVQEKYAVAMAADLAAYGISRWRAWYRLKYPTLYYQRILRRAELLNDLSVRWPVVLPLALVLRARLKMVGMKLGVSVPPGVFGPGLSIPHYGSVIVNNKARAGAFCRLHSSTNIGELNGHAPNIGNGVYIGPGAVVFGGVELGDNVVVGANAVVNKSIPSRCLAVGAPARSLDGASVHQRVMPAQIRAALSLYLESRGFSE